MTEPGTMSVYVMRRFLGIKFFSTGAKAEEACRKAMSSFPGFSNTKAHVFLNFNFIFTHQEAW